MSSAYRLLLVLSVIASASAEELRVCADPNNLPYSNARQLGFENELAQLVGRDLGRPIRYVWSPQRGAFLRKTLNAGLCDVVMGIPASMGRAAVTHPYYRSSYVFVWRRDHRLAIRSFDDRALKTARIGVQIIGDDGATVPPAQALIDRGLGSRIEWYRLFPDFTRENPPASLIDAVERGEIDVAVAWGPLAGYFARRSPVPLAVIPVSPQFEHSLPLAFDISMGVRRGDTRLLAELNATIEKHQAEIRRLLERYGVPLVSGEPQRLSKR